MKTTTEDRVERMRNGEKLPCPRCSGGLFFAVGNPKTTNIFSCNKCNLKMTLTVPIKL